MSNQHDLAIVGGGIVGLAVAHAFLREHPGASVVVLEKEDAVGRHQTSRNSGVVHSGVYYRPGSLKARTALAGRAALLRFCDEHGVAYRRCGKLIVATDDAELPRLRALQANAQRSGIPVDLLDPDGIARLEPHVTGIAALHVPGVAVVDFGEVARALAAVITEAGGHILVGARVDSIVDGPGGVILRAGGTEVTEVIARRAVNCGGLFSDRLAGTSEREVRIVPFRGEYYDVTGESASLVNALVYPVPDPRFPFLGVHFTRGVSGAVHAGPNAVLALSREGYRWRDLDLRELGQLAAFPGTWRLARRYWATGAVEVARSASKRLFVRALRRLVPDTQADDLRPGPAGVRAQAVDRHGRLLDDFVLRTSGRVVHVVNAPSPAATASLAIADAVVAELAAAGAGR